jgi:hypothetical protein
VNNGTILNGESEGILMIEESVTAYSKHYICLTKSKKMTKPTVMAKNLPNIKLECHYNTMFGVGGLHFDPRSLVS